MVDSRNYWSRRVNRRTALRGAALGATGLAGAVLIGCSDSDEDPTEAPGGGVAVAVARRPQRQPRRQRRRPR